MCTSIINPGKMSIELLFNFIQIFDWINLLDNFLYNLFFIGVLKLWCQNLLWNHRNILLIWRRSLNWLWTGIRLRLECVVTKYFFLDFESHFIKWIVVKLANLFYWLMITFILAQFSLRLISFETLSQLLFMNFLFFLQWSLAILEVYFCWWLEGSISSSFISIWGWSHR